MSSLYFGLGVFVCLFKAEAREFDAVYTFTAVPVFRISTSTSPFIAPINPRKDHVITFYVQNIPRSATAAQL